jgi:hypothetical protein
VFQPLLLKYFTYDELCRLKQKVIQQHVIQEQVRAAGLLEKQVTDELKLQLSKYCRGLRLPRGASGFLEGPQAS